MRGDDHYAGDDRVLPLKSHLNSSEWSHQEFDHTSRYIARIRFQNDHDVVPIEPKSCQRVSVCQIQVDFEILNVPISKYHNENEPARVHGMIIMCMLRN